MTNQSKQLGIRVALGGTKGGETKSTLALCLGHAKPFKKYKTCIVDLDSQESLANWHEERLANGLKSKVDVIKFTKSMEYFDEWMNNLSSQYDITFLDCPGESKAGELTRNVLIKCDVVIFPVKKGNFDLTALINNVLPILKDAHTLSDRDTHYFLLASMIHPNASKEKITKALSGDNNAIWQVFNEVFTERKLFDDFSEDGLTLDEYVKKSNKIIQKQGKKAIKNINSIAQELEQHLKLKQ